MASTAGAARGQSFEAAQPANPNQPNGRVTVGIEPPIGGAGTDDPGRRIRYAVISLQFLIGEAYPLKRGEKIATMPPDTTGEQFRAMLRDLPATGAGMFTTIGTMGVRLRAREQTMRDRGAVGLRVESRRPGRKRSSLTTWRNCR